MSFLRRAGGLAAATAALCLGATGVAQADLVRAYDFPGGELDASFDVDELRAPLKSVGATNDVFTEGQGYILATTGVAGAYSLDLSVRLGDLDPNPGTPGDFLQILRFADTGSGAEKDAGIYVEDGMLRYVDDDGNTGGDTFSGEPPLTPNADLRLTITFDPAEPFASLRIYRDSAAFPAIIVDAPADAAPSTSGIAFFRDDRLPVVAQLDGQMQRLRLFTGAVDPSSLQQFDTTAPDGVISDNGTQVVDGGELWVGPFAFFSMRATDDGTAPVDVDADILNDDLSGPIASDRGGPSSVGPSAGNEELTSFVSSTFDLGGLAEGPRYRFRAFLSDKAGNSERVERAFFLDKTPPSGLTLETPAQTTDRSPAIGGSAVVGARDEDHVFGTICKGTECDHQSETDYVGSFDAAIVNGKWGTTKIERFGQNGSSTRVGTLPLGTYAVVAMHFDRLMNLVEVTKVIDVVASKRAAPVPVSPPVVVTRPVVPQLLSPVALLQRNRGTIIASLQLEGLRGLTKDGKAEVDVFTDRPAAIVVQLFDGTAPKKVDAKASAAAKKKRKKKATSKLIATGRRTFFAPGAGKLTVKLTKKGKALLRNKKSRKVSVRTIIVPRGGAPISDTARLTLKR